jgi:hypothetical protein
MSTFLTHTVHLVDKTLNLQKQVFSNHERQDPYTRRQQKCINRT